MAFTQMIYSPETGLKDTTAFPKVPANEEAARKQFQDMFDQIPDFVNNTLISELTSTASGKGASQIGVTPFTGMTQTNVQSALEDLKDQMDGIVTAGLTDSVVTSQYIADGAVIPSKLGITGISFGTFVYTGGDLTNTVVPYISFTLTGYKVDPPEPITVTRSLYILPFSLHAEIWATSGIPSQSNLGVKIA
jgi:hypothetical protein